MFIVEESKALIERVSSRDPLALEGLYDAHRRGVYRLALRIGRNPAEAEEVVQDVFMELWRRPPCPDEVALRAWLTVKTKSLCWKRFRQQQRRPRLEPLEEDSGYIDSGLESVVQSSLLELIDRSLAGMTAVHRQVLSLTLFCGMGPTEIAEALGIPVITVRKRLSAAAGKLRGCIRRYTVEHRCKRR